MWVRFLADFDYSPTARRGWTTIAYKAGMEVNVRRECGEAAIGQGKAVAVTAPSKAGVGEGDGAAA